MKSGMLFVVATAIAILANGARADVLTFEDLSGEDYLASDYGGVSWSPGWKHYDSYQYPYTPASGSTRLYNNEDAGTTAFSFLIPVVFDGAYFSGFYNASYELYLDNVLVATSDLLSLSDVPKFLSSGYDGLIDAVKLNVTNSYFVMDNVTFNSSVAVPGPEAGTGLAGLAMAATGGYLLRRRRQRGSVVA